MARRDNVSLKTYMRDLHVTRVAFCAEGANGESDILLYKAKAPTADVDKVDSYVTTRNRLEAALADQFSSCWVRDFSDEFVVFEQYANGTDRCWRIGWKQKGTDDVELVGDREEVIVRTEFVPVTKEGHMPETDPTTADLTALSEAITAEAQKSADWLTACYAAQYLAEKEEFEKGLKGDTPDPLAKADPAVRAAMAKMAEENATLAKQVADLADERAVAKHTAVAKTLAHVGGSDDLVEVLKAVDEKAPEVAAKLATILSQAEERIAAGGLFKELGGGGIDAEDPIEKALADAKTPEDIEKVMNENPDAYAAYVAKQRARTTTTA